jgi:ATP-dependent DNA ligase
VRVIAILSIGNSYLLQRGSSTFAIRGIQPHVFNEHIGDDGDTVFRHACKLGLQGIVSKRKDSTYRSGRSPDWLKMKNVATPAMRREAIS